MKTADNLVFIDTAINVAIINMIGALIIIRSIIINVIWVFVTSDVSLVTRDAVENLSIFAKE